VSSDPELEKRLQEGIALARTGERAAARAILEEVVSADPYNETAWLWMAAVATTNAGRREALEIALEINPANREAREALNRLGGPRARRKAEEAQDIARRIGSDEVISEADFQPVIKRPAEPEPEPELSQEEQAALLTRDLLAAARAEQTEAEKAAVPPPAAPLPAGEEAPEAGAVEEKVVEVYVPPPVERARGRWLAGAAIVLAAAAVIALAGSLLGGGGAWLTPSTPTPDFATRLALLATDTPTYDPARIITGPAPVTPLPATWTPSHTPSPTATFTPSPLPPAPESYSLVFSRRGPDEEVYRLATVRGDGAGLETLTSGEGDDRAPAPGPGGRRLVYVTTVDGGRQLAALLLPGPPEARRTATPTPDPAQPAPPEDAGPAIITRLRNARRVNSPSWSPDGFRIVFSASVNGEEDIYLTDVDGTSFARLTANAGVIDRDPAWSPDGQTIVFVSDRDGSGQTELYRMRPDGTEVVRLTDSQGSSYSPAWSPDGREIVFVSDRDRDADLYLMNADGSNERLLTRNDSAEDRDPAWSPDGRWIVFSSNRDSENFRLFLIDPYSGEVSPVTTGADDAIEAAWLPQIARP